MLATNGNSCYYVIAVARNYNGDRDLAIVRAVSGVESTAATVEPDFTANIAAQGSFQFWRMFQVLAGFWHQRFFARIKIALGAFRPRPLLPGVSGRVI